MWWVYSKVNKANLETRKCTLIHSHRGEIIFHCNKIWYNNEEEDIFLQIQDQWRDTRLSSCTAPASQRRQSSWIFSEFSRYTYTFIIFQATSISLIPVMRSYAGTSGRFTNTIGPPWYKVQWTPQEKKENNRTLISFPKFSVFIRFLTSCRNSMNFSELDILLSFPRFSSSSGGAW